MGIYKVQDGQYAGLEIITKQVNPSMIQRVMASTEIPKRPTYETKTASGRVLVFPMDEQAAKETPGGENQWEYYQETLTNSRMEQNNKVVNALFLLGTECSLPSDGWEELDEALGLDVPEKENLKRAHFLMTHLQPRDIIGLTTDIMRETGVDEAVIQEAEDSFRDSVNDRPNGPGTMVDTLGHSGNSAV